MADTQATAGSNVTVDSTGGTFSVKRNAGKKGATTLWIRPRGASAVALLINVEGIHDAGEFVGLEPGVPFSCRVGIAGIGRFTAKGEGGSATFDYGLQALAGSP